MLIYDWYFKQAVTEEQMNNAFGAVQSSMFNVMTDQELVGIAQGGTPSPTSPTPNLAVSVGGPTIAYDQLGQRIYAATTSVDCSQDVNHVSTAVAGAGNEKYLSIFILFDRALSDPVIDGNGFTVFYVQAEGFTFEVIQGAEAPIGTATLPALINPGLLVCDVHLIHLQTQIESGDISVAREETTFAIVQSPFSVIAGTVPSAIAAMLTDLNEHVNGTSGEHPATAITTSAIAGTPLGFGTSTVQADVAAIVPPLNVLLNAWSLREIVAKKSGFTGTFNESVAGNFVSACGWNGAFTNCAAGDILEISTTFLAADCQNFSLYWILNSVFDPLEWTDTDMVTSERVGTFITYHVVAGGDPATFPFIMGGTITGSGEIAVNPQNFIGKHYRAGSLT